MRRVLWLRFSPALMLVLLLVFLSSRTEAAPPAQILVLPRDGRAEEIPFLGPAPEEAAPPVDFSVTDIVGLSKVVFQSFRDNNWEIYISDSGGYGQVRLTGDGAADVQPRLSIGCTRIVFSSKRSGNYDIWSMNLDGSGLARLTSDTRDDVNPAWSPDSARIAFQSYRDGQSEIYAINADGSGQVRLTTDGAYDGDPAWSPDGTRIAFTSNRSGGYGIWTMSADGSGLAQLAGQPYSENPVWSPDGSQIAYDADGDGDGWQELWVMNADGSNPRQVYDPGGTLTDIWAGGWSPDGRYVAFTRISFVYYQGSWYWTSAYLDAWDSTSGGTQGLTGQGVDWNPDWQSTDALAPSSYVQPMPAQSPSPIRVYLNGSDSGSPGAHPSGILGYELQVKDGPEGVWADWPTGEQYPVYVPYPGVGGHTYYFRCRARDYAGNVEPWPSTPDAFTTVEADPPDTIVSPLPAYSPGVPLYVQWGGYDPGGSGVNTYDVQYRDGAAGSWTAWQSATSTTGANFSGTAGHTYYFRSRAVDWAQNVEGWPAGDGDTHTTFYTWKFSGFVRDNTGTPVAGATAGTVPAALAAIPSDVQGSLATYVADDASTYAVDWSKSVYTGLPATAFDSSRDGYLDVVLPPADNLLPDWGFESGTFGPQGWLASGTFTPSISSMFRHTGNYAAMVSGEFVPPPVPTTTLNLSSNAADSVYPQLAISADKTVHVVWQDGASGNSEIYYARRDIMGMWSSPQNISLSSAASKLPELVVDHAGAAHVVWQEDSTQIAYARREPDGAWSTPVVVATTSGGSVADLRIAADGVGVVHLVWASVGDQAIFYVRRGDNGVWSSPLSVSNISHVSTAPQIAVDVENNLHLVWQDAVDVHSASKIYYTERMDDGSWLDAQTINHDYSRSILPQVVVAGDGDVHVVWLDLEYGSVDTWLYRHAWREAGGAWSVPGVIDFTAGNLQPAELAVDGDGNVYALWSSALLPGEIPGYFDVYCYRRGEDGSWSYLVNVSNSRDSSLFPRMLVDGNGILHAVWTELNSEQARIDYSWRSLGGEWAAPVTVSDASLSVGLPEVAVDWSGTPHVVWADVATPGQFDVFYWGPASHTSLALRQAGSSTIAQGVTIPLTMSSPVLSLLYRLSGASYAAGVSFQTRVETTVTATTLFSTTTNAADWTHLWLDLSPWTGQTISLTFGFPSIESGIYPRVYLDEITLGSAYPDVWVRATDLATTPGRTIRYTANYGNRGQVEAGNTRVTATLPSELYLVAASPPPVTTTPALVWAVGNLAGGSGPFSIVVTATVAPTTTSVSTLTCALHISTGVPEVEQSNNLALSTVLVAFRTYLPIVTRGYFH